jgi:hypothetical protein
MRVRISADEHEKIGQIAQTSWPVKECWAARVVGLGGDAARLDRAMPAGAVNRVSMDDPSRITVASPACAPRPGRQQLDDLPSGPGQRC